MSFGWSLVRDDGGGVVYYNGLIAVYRTYKRALTNTEITQNWNAEKSLFGY